MVGLFWDRSEVWGVVTREGFEGGTWGCRKEGRGARVEAVTSIESFACDVVCSTSVSSGHGDIVAMVKE